MYISIKGGYEKMIWSYGRNRLLFGVIFAVSLALIGKPVFASGGVHNRDKTYDTLSAAISEAADGDTITLTDDLTENSDVFVEQRIILDLNGHTVTGPASGSLFTIREGKVVTIKDGVLTDPDGSSGSAALLDIGMDSVLTLENVNVTERSGGAINARYGNLYLTGCTITGFEYGIVLRNSGLNTIDSSCISTSTRYGSYGIKDEENSNITIKGGSIDSYGNALVVGGSSELTLSDAVLTSNSESGIDLNGTKAEITGCTISGSNAVRIKTDNPTGAYNPGETVRSDVTMTECIMEGKYGVSSLNSNLVLKNCGITATETNTSGVDVYSTMPADEELTVTLDGTEIHSVGRGVVVKDCTLNILGGTKIISGSENTGNLAGILANSDDADKTCIVNVKDSTISGRKGIECHGKVSLQINSGTVIGTNVYGIEFSQGILNIAGGTIVNSLFIVNPDESELSITGGTFRGGNIYEVYTNGAFPKGFITGGLFEKGKTLHSGTYKDALGEGSIAEGYSAIPATQTGYYQVVEGSVDDPDPSDLSGDNHGTTNPSGGNTGAAGGSTGSNVSRARVLGIGIGQTGIASGNTFKALSSSAVSFTKAANKKTVIVPAAVTINGKNYIVDQIEADAFRNSKATKVTIEKNIKIIKAKAFNKSKIKTLIVKSKNLKKAVSVKQCFKGCKSSKITVVFGSVGKKYVNKSFTAKNTKAKKIVLKKR